MLRHSLLTKFKFRTQDFAKVQLYISPSLLMKDLSGFLLVVPRKAFGEDTMSLLQSCQVSNGQDQWNCEPVCATA